MQKVPYPLLTVPWDFPPGTFLRNIMHRNENADPPNSGQKVTDFKSHSLENTGFCFHKTMG